MSGLWKILEACRAKKMMVRVAFFPGGHINVAIYNNEEESKQYLYDSPEGDVEKIEREVRRDFGKLISTTALPTIPSLPTLPKLPSIPPIPGFPRLP